MNKTLNKVRLTVSIGLFFLNVTMAGMAKEDQFFWLSVFSALCFVPAIYMSLKAM